MKKALSLILAMAIVVTLVACSATIDGTYKAVSMSAEGITIDLTAENPDAEAIESAGGITLEFKKDGTVVFNAAGSTADATYNIDGNKVSIDNLKGESITGEIKGASLNIEIEGVEYSFERQ